MGLMAKIAAVGLLLVFLSACFRKKTSISNLQDWLDKHYPSRFQVLSTSTDDAIRNLSFKVKNSLVAEKSNPLVQVKLKWDKRSPELNLTTGLVDTAFAQAQTYFQDAQDLLRALKTHGFEKPVVSIRNGTASMLLFHEATEEYRQECLTKLETVFHSWSKTEEYDKEILLLVKAGEASIPGEILPISYFMDGQYLKQVVYRFQLPYNQDFIAEKVSDNWSFNTASDQFTASYEKAKTSAETWATQHYKPSFFLMDETEFEQLSEKPLRYQFKFAFTEMKQAEDSTVYVEPDGYFMVDFDMEKSEAIKIKVTKE